MGSQEQARRMRQQTEEELRRKALADAMKVSGATAAGAASGVELDSPSLQVYLKAMRDEMTRQSDWIRKAGAANAGAVSTAGDIGLFTNLGGTLFNYAKQNNWWKGAGG
jgi:precorrin-3B methylase